MKELPYLEEIYDFETDQLETLLTDIEKLLDPNQRPTQLPKGYESFEKLERKAIKLKEHVELELEERRQVDDVISFFVSKAGVGSKQIDLLSDEQFYQPAGPSKPKPEIIPQPLPLNPQNLAMLPQKQQVSLLAPPSNVNFDEQQSSSGVNHSQFDAQLSDVHSSVSRQLFDQRGPGSGVAVGANAMKNKKDLQAFMREKLAKTKISSEATSSIQPIAQNNKNFTGLPIKKRDDDARSSVAGSSVSGVSGMPRSSTADKQSNFYKPQLKNTKESANFVSGPSKPVMAARKASAVRQEKPVKQSSENGQKADKKNLNNDKPKQAKPPKKEPDDETSAPLAKQQSNIYKPAIKKPSSRQSSKPPVPVKKELSKQGTLNDSKLPSESQASTKDRSEDVTDEDVGQWSSQVPQTLSSDKIRT